MSAAVTAAVADYPHTRRLLAGPTTIAPGLVLTPRPVVPIVDAYRRQVRELEFDVCEVALSTYLIAREHGVPIVALPVMLNRRMHHRDVVVRSGSGIAGPHDLAGRRVGVRAYSVTSAVWARGVLAHQYGVDLDRITWVVDDEENVADLVLPANVLRAPVGTTLQELFDAGEIDAAFGGWAGVGRKGPPTTWQNGTATARPDDARDLIPDPARDERDWFARSGWYPIHGVLTVTRSALESHSGLADAAWESFSAAREDLISALAEPATTNEDVEIARYRRLQSVVGGDPLPYGRDANRVSIEAAIRLCRDQGLLARAASADDVFLDY